MDIKSPRKNPSVPVSSSGKNTILFGDADSTPAPETKSDSSGDVVFYIRADDGSYDDGIPFADFIHNFGAWVD